MSTLPGAALVVLAETRTEMIALLTAVFLVIPRGGCILTKTDPEKEANATTDNVPQQSIARGFTFGEDGHVGYGVSPTAGYGEGYDHYVGNYDAGKHYGYDDHYKHEHKEHDPAYYKALALKGLLIPLAGVALLGAAAAFVSNPVLLQLGVISSTYGRKKRDVSEPKDLHSREKFHDIQLLEKFMAQVPREEMRFQEERLFANYLRCSGAVSESACLERLACELHSSAGASMPVETNVMAIITNEILSNKYVAESIKSRIVRAVQRGRSNGSCLMYKCRQLAKLTDSPKIVPNHT